jgi:fumarate hydratase class I
MPEFVYQPLFEHGHDETPWRRLEEASSHIGVERQGARRILKVGAEALRLLAAEALDDVSHLLRPGHLAQLRKILDDPESSANDRRGPSSSPATRARTFIPASTTRKR